MCATTGALLIAGGIAQGVAGYAGQQAQAKSLKYQANVASGNAQMKEAQAENERERGATEAAQLRNQASKVLAAQVAATAASGVDIGGDTAREVFLSTELTSVADELESMKNTSKNVWTFTTEAANLRNQARQLKKAAATTELLAPVAAISPLVTGFGRAKIAQKRGI